MFGQLYNTSNDDSLQATQAIAKDMAFFLKRQDAEIKTGWTHFNQSNCSANHEMTSVGYIPIVQTQAHELDTLHTVTLCCICS